MEDMTTKFKGLKLGMQLVAIGGVVMLIASFLEWYNISVGGFGSGGESGWGAPGSLWSILAILLSIVLALSVLLPLFNVELPALPAGWSWGLVYGAGAAAVIILMLLKFWRIISVDACGPLTDDLGCSDGAGIGFYIGALAAIAIAAGGWMMYSEEKKGVM